MFREFLTKIIFLSIIALLAYRIIVQKWPDWLKNTLRTRIE